MRNVCSDISLKSFAKILTCGKGKNYSSLSSLLTSGNTKVPRTTAIFNMSSAHNCPALKLGLCKAVSANGKNVCYARKFENSMRKSVQPHRENQGRYWLSCTAEEFVSQFILINALKESAWKTLRFNEAGDFHSQDCVNKAEKIALLLSRYGIRCYCYTSRSDLDYSGCRNLIVSGSGFKSEGINNVFKMVEDIEKERPKGWGICSGDCRICNRCMVRGNNTVVLRH
jgi:hypothetical protein